MRKIYLSILTVLALGVFLGFSNSDNPKKMSYNYSGPSNGETYVPISNPDPTDALYYSDNFDLPSDTSGLIARGYLVYYRGTGTQAAATWFQGNSTVFQPSMALQPVMLLQIFRL